MTEVHGRTAGGLAPGRSMALDAIRGGLVILMVMYHAAYVAVLSGLAQFGLYEGFWWIFPRAIAAGFIALSGWSLAGKKARGNVFKAFLMRASRLAIPALAITLISALMFRQGFVFFGILHLLAASSILAWPFLGRPMLAMAAGLALMGGGLMLGSLRFDWPYLAWLGFRPAGLYPVDYLPLLPWFAWCLLGAAARDLSLRPGLGRNLGRGFDQTKAPAMSSGKSVEWSPTPASATPRQAVFLEPLACVGRHSLGIYLVHLPILYGLASLLALLTGS